MPNYGVSIPVLDPRIETFGDLARLADEAGFRSLWITEAYRNPFVLHAVTSATTSRIGLGTGIAEAFIRSPFEAANAAADVDELSHGRAVAHERVRRRPEDDLGLLFRWRAAGHGLCWEVLPVPGPAGESLGTAEA